MLQEFKKFALRGNVVDQATTYDAAKKAGATLGYGQFLTVTVNFIIIAWVIFIVIKGMNTLFAKEQDAPPPPKPPSKEEELLAEIRDLLRARAGDSAGQSEGRVHKRPTASRWDFRRPPITLSCLPCESSAKNGPGR